MTKEFKIDGMSCGHCVARVEKAVASLGLKANVSLEKKTAVVEGENIDEESVKEAIEDLGFDVI